MSVSHRFYLGSLAALVLATAAWSGDWPHYLGPQRNAIVAEKGLNTDWQGKPPATLWKVPLGNGFSSIIVVGDRLYTQTQRGARDGVVCLDAKDGKEIWFFDAVPTYIDKQKHGYGPRATPAFYDGKLYCLFAMGELFCLTADGKQLWQADLFKDTGAKNRVGETYYWGVSSSPFVEGDLVIVQPGGDKNNSVAAYHKATGKLVWTTGDDPICYATPIAITVAGQRQLIVPTGQSILGIEPTKGKVLWRYSFGNEFNATCASPVWADGLLFVSAAYRAGSAALEIVPPSTENNQWSVREKWKNVKALQNLMATSVILDGRIYAFHGDLSAFALRCLDLKTGQTLWDERMQGRYSLLAMDGHLLCLSERGNLLLVKAQEKSYELKGELANVLTYKAWAAPAFSNGKLFLRDQKQILCIDLSK